MLHSQSATVQCETAECFLNQLDELHPRWGEGKWIFRGQNSDAENWKLLPSAMRSDIIEKFVEKNVEQWSDLSHLGENIRQQWENKPCNEFRRHVEASLHIAIERCLVWAFERLADQVGLHIPYQRRVLWGGGSRSSVEHETIRLLTNDAVRHHPNEVIFALAQHHGIPTRLLDWTYRPLVAAYFSAYCEKPHTPQPQHIVVWAINLRELNRTNLHLTQHLYSDMSFPYAQAGVWLYDKETDSKFLENGSYAPFEDELCKIGSDDVQKLTLPYSERQELLELLQRKEVFKSSLMPFYGNVADDLMNCSMHWRKITQYLS